MEKIDLNTISKEGLVQARDKWTKDLVRKQDVGWGPARKALNLFLRDLSYNYMTRREFGLRNHDEDLEVPLDGKVMTRIRAEANHTNLARITVVGLTEEISRKYQIEALRMPSKGK